MRIQSKILVFYFIFLTHISCEGWKISKDVIKVDAYSSYNNATIPETFDASGLSTNYDSIIKYAESLIGLPNTDIEIETTSSFGAL